MRARAIVRGAGVWVLLAGCSGGGGGDDGPTSMPTTVSDPTSNTTGTSLPTTGNAATGDSTGDTPTTAADGTTEFATTQGDPSGPASSSSGTTAAGCGACDEPNQQCIDDLCVTSCQGQDPDPCGPAQVCDVISGTCKDIADTCVLAGPTVACGDQQCGPGTVCDDQNTCLAVAPCELATCTTEGACWGSACACDRAVSCSDPPIDLLNGAFASDISGLDFADDCTAWSVTVSGGQEFVRRLTEDGTLDSWGANGDYDLGEVRVLRHLTIPQISAPPDLAALSAAPPRVEGYGEVALTYICCPTCGDCAGNPDARGVAHLVEEDPNMPLPIVIFAEPTQGTGPFGQMHMDGGPQGLTWGEDRVLYVGNTKMNGQFDSADLEMGSVSPEFTFPTRTTAAAPVSPVHILVALEDGTLHRFNTVTKQTEFVVDLMSGVTSLSHDAFNGDVYASLASLEVVRVRPFTGYVESFAMMPAKGRVAVSPSGNLWFTPVKFLNPGTLSSWPLPATL